MKKDEALNLKRLSQLIEARKATTLVKVTSKGLQKCPSSKEQIIKGVSLWICVCVFVLECVSSVLLCYIDCSSLYPLSA